MSESDRNQGLRGHPFNLAIPPPPTPPNYPKLSIPPPPFPPPLLPVLISNPNIRMSQQYPTSVHSTQTFQGSNVPPAQSQPWCRVVHNLAAPESCQHDEIKENSVNLESLNSNSQYLLDSWLIHSRISHNIGESPKTNKSVKIYEVKEKFNSAFRLIKALENGARTLSVMVKTVSPSEWKEKCNEIEVHKKELMNVLNELKLSSEEVDLIKQKCLNRSKKRARLKRKLEKRKKAKEEEKVKIQNLHFQINNWQKEMQDVVERTQREEELQREADAVLWGVTHKKAEARRQVGLLAALLELRAVRVKRLTAAGSTVSQSEMDTCTTVIERLKTMWSKHLDECLLEEQALRGMLSEAVVEEDPVKTYKKLVLQGWENALFGSALDHNTTSEDLICIRHGWDQFSVREQTVLASTIPPGWVLPVPPSSDQWRSLLKY